MKTTYKRPIFGQLASRIESKRKFIHVLQGSRHTGKTTLAHQVMQAVNIPNQYASADEPALRDTIWIEQQWEVARQLVKESVEALLILDEIQKISGWSEVVKRLWDEDNINKIPVKVIILGSSPLLVQKGLTESLAGRFELIFLPHWSFSEMQAAFGWSLNQYLFFGGYPGAAELISDQQRWKNYINHSLIETVLSKDILLMTRVDKPALLRQLFYLGCDYSAQILSYQKMLGQLQDAGNTTTLAHYLNLLTSAGMLTGLQKFTGSKVLQRASSPKLQVLNTAFLGAQTQHSFTSVLRDREYWGRIVESAVGAHLVNSTLGTNLRVYYWRERNREVDFVLQSGTALTAIEVKSGRRRDSLRGLRNFDQIFSPQRKFLVGGQGMPLEDFFKRPARAYI